MRGLSLTLLGLALALPAPGADDVERIARLVDLLGSPKYAEREKATQELDTIGPPALEALRQAVQSDDAEVRRRALALIQKIERRRDAVRLLAPQRVRLVFRDTPVEEAIAEVARKTGFTIKLESGRPAAGEQKVTLDTGETTFWEAFERFCAAAGLVEMTPRILEKNAGRSGVSSGVTIIGGNRPITPRDIMNPDGSDRPVVLTLTAGKPRELPTHYAGALRVQALPPGTEVAGLRKAPGEALLALNVMAEPSLRWERVLGLRLDRAIDDQDQPLRQLPTPFSAPAPASRNTGGMVIINGVPLNPEPSPFEGELKQVPVRLKQGEKPAKQLKELSGTIAAVVSGPVEPLVTVDNILQSAGKVVAGERGGSVKVISVQRHESGLVNVVVHVEAPARKIDDGSAAPVPNMTVIINGRVIGQPDEEPLHATNFALVDDQGRPYQVIRATNTGRLTGATQELNVTFDPRDVKSTPDRFIFSGRRAAVVEVPFRLKDVPLP